MGFSMGHSATAGWNPKQPVNSNTLSLGATAASELSFPSPSNGTQRSAHPHPVSILVSHQPPGTPSKSLPPGCGPLRLGEQVRLPGAPVGRPQPRLFSHLLPPHPPWVPDSPPPRIPSHRRQGLRSLPLRGRISVDSRSSPASRPPSPLAQSSARLPHRLRGPSAPFLVRSRFRKHPPP